MAPSRSDIALVLRAGRPHSTEKTPSSLRLEQVAPPQSQSVEPVLPDGLYGLQAVLRAAAEVDLARLLEVPHRHRHVAEAKPEVDRLHEELRVEDEVVA